METTLDRLAEVHRCPIKSTIGRWDAKYAPAKPPKPGVSRLKKSTLPAQKKASLLSDERVCASHSNIAEAAFITAGADRVLLYALTGASYAGEAPIRHFCSSRPADTSQVMAGFSSALTIGHVDGVPCIAQKLPFPEILNKLLN